MNLSGYFIDRPIFASVLSIMVFIAGAIAMLNLPISEYPEVSPPSVNVSASFPGANPTTIAETVATPLEEAINGVENMLYMSSLASTDGAMSLTVTFKIGSDVDLAQQLVQNRVSQAIPRLPDVTRQLGVTVTKSSPDLTMVVHLRSPDNSYDELYLRNFATINVKDELAKVQGVGRVAVFGSGDYAMRVWLNPEAIAELDMSAGDVINAIRGQNVQVSAGKIGGAPYDDGAQIELPINTQGRLQTPEEFENIIIKTDENGILTRLGDVARLELGAQTYALRSLLNNNPAVAIPIFAAPEANALDISSNVRQTMAELQKDFPEGIEYTIVYDPTVFVRYSIESVIETLFQAVALVVLVVIVFLQTWRASIIPFLAVPISIVGTFSLMLILGFSINVLSLFGLILAIGIVVDDAIVVVENVERNIAEGKKPHEATLQAMKEVTGPVIATSLVLISVFVPIAFISGLTGQFYRQFAVTIAFATIISTFVALTLSPAMSAKLLQTGNDKKDLLTKTLDVLFGWFFKIFNKGFEMASCLYGKLVGMFVRRRIIMLIIYGFFITATVYSFNLVPKGFIPVQDKQYLVAFAKLPPGANLERTEEVLRKMGEIALTQEGVQNAVQFPGLSIAGFSSSASSGIVFLPLDDFAERTRPDLYGPAIAGQLQGKFMAIDEAFIAIFPPPPVRGMGTVGGFALSIQDKADLGIEALNSAVEQVSIKANQHPALMGVFSNYNVNFPQLYANMDRERAQQLGIPIQEVFETMQIYLGSRYVNDFNLFGRTYQVIAQADKQYRADPSDILQLKTRNIKGDMVPLGAVMNVEETFGPEVAQRYNAFRSADLNGNAAPGYSTGEAQDAIVQVLEETLPPGMGFEWTGLTYQQILAGNTAVLIFPLCLLLAYLVLAAQYENLFLPIAVILIVPMSMLSAMVGVYLFGAFKMAMGAPMGMDNNIFTQISLFVLAGLACKNAILIVEFARDLERQGRGIIDAAIEAARMRLRPILMTSFSFILGVLPLVLSTGAGAEMRQAIGIAVFSGMLGVTFFGIVFTPLFYVVMRKIENLLTGGAEKPAQAEGHIE
jgi:multidrug efflux pump